MFSAHFQPQFVETFEASLEFQQDFLAQIRVFRYIPVETHGVVHQKLAFFVLHLVGNVKKRAISREIAKISREIAKNSIKNKKKPWLYAQRDAHFVQIEEIPIEIEQIIQQNRIIFGMSGVLCLEKRDDHDDQAIGADSACESAKKR